MRITNQLIQTQNIARIQSSLQAVDAAREQVSTGKKISVMSDDPAGASEVVRTSSALRALSQYRRNNQLAQNRGTAEENALDQLTNTLDRGVELATQQASSSSTAQTRLIAKAEVDQLLSFAVGLGNTKYGDDYLFGGTRGGEAPLQIPVTSTDGFSALKDSTNNPVNPSGGIPLEIRDGHTVVSNHNATEVFLDTGSLQALRDLSTALGSNDVPGINTALQALHNANNSVQTVTGTQGSRMNEFLITSAQLDKQETSLTAYRSNLSDVDVETAMVQLAGRTTGYQAAMTATSKVLGLSLANYL
jgi:flagellar hook-associated protein 3 FlgL